MVEEFLPWPIKMLMWTFLGSVLAFVSTVAIVMMVIFVKEMKRIFFGGRDG